MTSSLPSVDDPIMALKMKAAGGDDSSTRQNNKMAAVSVMNDAWKETEKDFDVHMFDGNSMETSLFRVLSTAFLITGNTVGA